MSINVAIVEDNREIREGLSLMISQADGFECVGRCRSAEQALKELPQREVDVLLLDIGLPGMSGIECIRRVKILMPRTEIMMLTVFDDPDRIFQALSAGATGYLVKTTPAEKLLEAIRDLHNGGSPMSNQIARRVISTFQQTAGAEAPAPLTVREQQVLEHLSRGLLYKQIAEKLCLSTETVRTHVRNIYKKLHVRTRAEALRKMKGP